MTNKNASTTSAIPAALFGSFARDAAMTILAAVIVAAMLTDDYKDGAAACVAALLVPIWRLVWRLARSGIARHKNETDEDWLDRQI